MQVSAWIERLASDLLDTETELRAALAQLRRSDRSRPYVARTARGSTSRGVIVSENEARTLLRAAMPLPVGSCRLRQPHARMLAALQLFAGHLLALNDPLTTEEHAAGAGAALLDELRTWLAVARWHSACRAAGVRWPMPEHSITRLPHPQTAAETEHDRNTQPPLPIAALAAATPDTPATALRAIRRKDATAAATQDALALALATAAGPPAPVVLLRPQHAAQPSQARRSRVA